MATNDERFVRNYLRRRMGNFEHDLCTTVDSILQALGYEPTVVRHSYQQQQQLLSLDSNDIDADYPSSRLPTSSAAGDVLRSEPRSVVVPWSRRRGWYWARRRGRGHIMPSDRLRPGVALLFQCFPVKSFCHLLRLQFDTHLQQRFIQSLAQQHQCCIVFVFFFFLLHSRFVERSVFVSLLGNNLEIQKSAIPLPLSFAPAAFDQVFCC